MLTVRLPSGCDAWHGMQLPTYESPAAHQPPQTLAPTTPRAGAGASAAPPPSPKEAGSELLRTHLQVLSNYVDRCQQSSRSSPGRDLRPLKVESLALLLLSVGAITLYISSNVRLPGSSLLPPLGSATAMLHVTQRTSTDEGF